MKYFVSADIHGFYDEWITAFLVFCRKFVEKFVEIAIF